jgi:preprotein translocase subunit SecF
MLVGMIVGVYSSVFIAAPIVIVWEDWKSKRSPKKSAPAPAPNGKGKAAAKAR